MSLHILSAFVNTKQNKNNKNKNKKIQNINNKKKQKKIIPVYLNNLII